MSDKTILSRPFFADGANVPYSVADEVSAAATASEYEVLPVNTSAAARTITPPTATKKGSWFTVVDSRANAGSNNLTIDFSASNRFQGAATDLVLNTDGAFATFVWSGVSAIGWIRVA